MLCSCIMPCRIYASIEMFQRKPSSQFIIQSMRTCPHTPVLDALLHLSQVPQDRPKLKLPESKTNGKNDRAMKKQKISKQTTNSKTPGNHHKQDGYERDTDETNITDNMQRDMPQLWTPVVRNQIQTHEPGEKSVPVLHVQRITKICLPTSKHQPMWNKNKSFSNLVNCLQQTHFTNFRTPFAKQRLRWKQDPDLSFKGWNAAQAMQVSPTS